MEWSTWEGNRRFYVDDDDAGCFTSPWFEGTHPVMLSYGHTTAPWYASHVHHGVDIDMPSGTPIRSAVSGTVLLRPDTLGAGYGANRLLVRSRGVDHVIGHLGQVQVRDGQHVEPGEVIGTSGMSGTEDMDGPHLHFEVRPAGTRYSSAVDPWPALRAERA
ncbi:M23 family metallopeptidase [Luteococcus peritonei]|uniref:M23 family metallopeptidase n=1 Tax=Luteococcus peritonei TaxID=88874 RepID=A0ABW4RXI7_9ACTN